MAAGYDISASASQATSASGGATRLGNVNILGTGGNAGLSGFNLVAIAGGALVVIALVAFWFFSNRKKR